MSEIDGGKAMHPSLRLVNERFHQEICERSARLFEQDADFRDICEEYGACAQMVTRLDAGGPAAEGLRDEYAALLRWLERELRRYLEEHPDREES